MKTNRMVFAAGPKWVVERLQRWWWWWWWGGRGGWPVFTQFASRLAAPASGLEGSPISATSILYQQWRMCVDRGCLGLPTSRGSRPPPPPHLSRCSSLCSSLFGIVRASVFRVFHRRCWSDTSLNPADVRPLSSRS